MREKAVVKVHESNESAELTLRLGLREVANGLNFVRERGDTMTVDAVSEEVQCGYAKKAFVGVDDDAVGGEAIKNYS